MELDHRAINAWYEAHRQDLFLRDLWLLGGEPNTHDPKTFGESRVRILIGRLSGYHEVATGITHSYLHQLASAIPGAFVDLAFLPPQKDENSMREAGIPLWVGTTTKRPPADFDLIAISNSVVQELLNLPALLHDSGIPLSRRERAEKGAPLVILGGSNSYATSILHGPIARETRTLAGGASLPKDEAGVLAGVRDATEPDAGLVDGVIVGDGEEAFPLLIKLLAEDRGQPRDQLLKLFREKVPGFYDPAAITQEFDAAGHLQELKFSPAQPKPVRSAKAFHGPGQRTFHCGPLFYDEDSAGSSHLFISSGCPYFCSFCKESWEQKPYRERDLKTLLPDALALKANLGLSEIALMSFNANTWSSLSSLLNQLEPLFHRVAMKSQRFDAIVQSPFLLERQLEAGKRTYTCAMEGISKRLRGFLQKNLPEEILLKGFALLFQRNIRQMKVFIIVTGQEEPADLQEFDGLLTRLQQMLGQLKGKPVLTFSLAALFRPPFTPLQFCRHRSDEKGLVESFARIARSIEKAGFETRISAGPEDALVSEFLAYADRRHTAILVEASLRRRFRYRGSIDLPVYRFWKDALKAHQLKSSFAPREVDETTVFPWDDIDSGVTKAFLWKNYQALVAGKELSSCIAEPLGLGRCQQCGACTTPKHRAFLQKLLPQKAGNDGQEGRGPGQRPSAAQAAADVSVKGGPAKPLHLRLTGHIPLRWAAVGNQFLFAAFARMMMLGHAPLISEFIHFEQAIDRPLTAGVFLADFLVRSLAAPLDRPQIDAMNSFGQGLEILSIRPAGKSLVEEPPPLICRFHLPTPPDPKDLSKRIDDFMQRYKFKHQKQWLADVLTWTLQAGHARKSGVARIEWQRDSRTMELFTLHAVEPHIYDKIGGKAEREFLLPETVRRS